MLKPEKGNIVFIRTNKYHAGVENLFSDSSKFKFIKIQP